MNKNNPKAFSSLKSRALLGTAAAALLAGVLAGEATLLPNTPAFAAPVQVQPVQVPDFADLVEKVSPAVVGIRVKNEARTTGGNMGDLPFEDLPPGFQRFFRDFGGQMPDTRQRPTMGLGSGFFISGDGYIVTNNHVVDSATEFTVIMNDGTEYPARLIGKDDKTDLAVVKVDADHEFDYVQFADAEPRIGEWVIAVGSPFGLGGTVTAGIVSGHNRQIGNSAYDDYIQIDAAVNRGNSGGPTFNRNGKVVSINTAIYSPSGGNVGIAFGVPATVAKQVTDQLMAHGTVARGWLGVQIQPVTGDIAQGLRLDQAQGALVAETQPDSPALAAGIRAGDAIIAVDGKAIADARDLALTIGGYRPNSDVTVTLWRDGAKQDVKVKLGQLPGADQQASLATPQQQAAAPAALEGFGLSLAPADQGEGVVIADIDPNGEAADSGLRQGDVILSVGQTRVTNPSDVEKAVASARQAGLKAVLFRVRSGDNTRFVALPFRA